MREVSLFNRKVYRKDVIILIIILLLPFSFYLHVLIPDVKTWKTDYFTYHSVYFESVKIFFWTLLTKLLTFLFLSLWFITCKHWWRYVILVPIIIESYKIFEVINSDYKNFDHEFINSIPFTFPIILLLLYLTKRLNYYSQYINTSAELDKEINLLLNELSMFKEENFKSVKKQLAVLRNQKETMNNEAYLKKLIELRNTITNL